VNRLCEPIDVWDSDGEVTVIPAGCHHLVNLLAATKWPRASSLRGHVARALTFFEDAEKDPAFAAGMSQHLRLAVKAYFEAHGPDLLPIARPAG